MSASEVEALLAHVSAGAVSPKTAVQLLVIKGLDQVHAEQIVWRAARARTPAVDRVSAR